MRDPALQNDERANAEDGGGDGRPAVGRRTRTQAFMDTRRDESPVDMDAMWAQGVQRKEAGAETPDALVAHDVSAPGH